MSRGVNKVTLLGNVGKDPEIRTTAGGTIVASVTLATNDRRKTQNGDWQDAVEWHNLVLFNRTAEVVRDYVKKGSQLFIEGKIQTRSWDDKDSGQKRYRTEILVNEMVMLGEPSANGGYREVPATAGKPAAAGYAKQPPQQYADDPNIHGEYITDDDIPF